MTKISPSILSCDFAKLKEDIDTIIDDIDYLHIDVMDGLFVNNISFGIPVIKSIRPHYKKVFDTHLMIVNPERYIDAFAKAGADLITFHVEATADVKGVIDLIHSKGLKAGISLRPNTSVEALQDYLDSVELVLVMSVEPGFGGQAFDSRAIDKIKWLSEIKQKNNYHYEIEVDGGINDVTGPLCVEAGAEVLVSGSYIFKAKNRKEAISLIK
jgi:ribulose-phosphate 3-epimerase